MWTGIWVAVSVVCIVTMVLLIKSMNKVAARPEERKSTPK